MSRFSGPQGKGAHRRHRELVRNEAERAAAVRRWYRDLTPEEYLLAAIFGAPEVHDCGHVGMSPGCGGCDPSAIDAVYDERARTWRAFDPARDLASSPLSPRSKCHDPAHPPTESEETR